MVSPDHSSSDEEHEEADGEVLVEEDRPDLDEPRQYAVVLHNDNYTTMEFVIEVLQKFFKKNLEEAKKIMLKVHHDGKGVAGTFSFQIAETKVAQVMDYARANGHPLKCSAEPLD